MTGKILNEMLGKISFWLFFIGMNLTFFPMHFVGLDGMPRRIYTYSEGMGWDLWNAVSTVGVFVIALGILVFMQNVWHTSRKGKQAGSDPWDGRTLEWAISSPPPEYNFAEIPNVDGRDSFWGQKYSEGPDGNLVKVLEKTDPIKTHSDDHDIHLPTPSYYPLLVALGVTLIAAGLLSHLFFTVFGGVLTFLAVLGWALEPPTAPSEDGDHRSEAY